MPVEEPPLNASIILSFQDASTSYPVLAVAKEPRAGGYGGPTVKSTGTPAIGSQVGLSVEAIATWPTAGFTRIVETSNTRCLWIFEILPGPILTTKVVLPAFNGNEVDTTVQHVLNTTNPDTGNYILESSVTPENAVTGSKRTTKFPSSTLPTTLVTPFWDWVSLPLLVFAIVPVFYCNNSQFLSAVVNYDTAMGASMFRKHRRTVSYSNTKPDPDLSTSAYTTADLRYSGKVISFSLSNVLNDALSYDEDAYTSSGGSACFWTEAWTYAATTPSATAFAAGMWVTKGYESKLVGPSLWETTRIEYYSVSGNPSI